MIKANQLRIGTKLNYISAEGDVLVSTIDDQDIKWCVDDNVGFNLVHKPIELTEEILLKCDEIVKNNSFYPYKFLNGLIKIRNGIYFFKYYGIEIELPFLHQLQNLFFALTNEELQINL